MNTPDIALAALIIACVAMVGSLISDSILLAEYSAYLDFKENMKTFLKSKTEIAMLRQIVEMMAKKMAEAEAADAAASQQVAATAAMNAKQMWEQRQK